MEVFVSNPEVCLCFHFALVRATGGMMYAFSFSLPFGTEPVVLSGVPLSSEIAEAAAAFARTRVSFQTVIVCQPLMMYWKPCAVASWPLSGIGFRPWAFRSAPAEGGMPALARATP